MMEIAHNFMSLEEADETLKKYMNGDKLSYCHIGTALTFCNSIVLKESADSITQQLSLEIKSCHHPAKLVLILGCVETLLNRLAQDRLQYPSSLTKLVALTLHHQTSSLSNQCLILHCLTHITVLYPHVIKEHRQHLLSWSKDSLFTESDALIKESAQLLLALNCTGKNEEEYSKFFISAVQSLYHCIAILTGTEEEDSVLPLLIIPEFESIGGIERLKIIVNGVTGLTRLVSTCLLVQTTYPLNVSLDKLFSVIWLAMDSQVSVPNIKLVLLEVSWQLLLVTIHSCRLHLMPYTETIETAIIKVLQQTPPKLIMALILECIQEWVQVRGGCPHHFMETTISFLCLQAHHCIKIISDLDRKWKNTFRTNQDSKFLERLIKTLHICLQKCDNLPLTIIKGINSICLTLHSSSLTYTVDELHQLVKTLIRNSTCGFELQLDEESDESTEEIDCVNMETTVLTTPSNVSEAKPHSPICMTHTKTHMSSSDSHMTSIPIERESDEDVMLMEVFNTDKEK